MTEEVRLYIENAPEQGKQYLKKTYDIARVMLVECEEKIAWNMPSFYDGKRPVFQFASMKNHLGIYPGPDAIVVFADRLKEYKTSKGAIQIRYNQPYPEQLIRDLITWCDKNNH